MTEGETLNVWFGPRLVGVLWRDAPGGIGFRYAPDWIAAGGFAVSRSLPLTNRRYPPAEGVAHRCFANLLPEGAVREHLVRDLKLPDTDFDLLCAIGGECAGALSLLPADRQPASIQHYRPLTDTELAHLVARRGRLLVAGPEDERPRLSLAGAQDATCGHASSPPC